MVLPLRTLSTSLVPRLRRLAERNVTFRLRWLACLLTDLRVPATRSVANSVAAVLTGVRRVTEQVTALREPASLHAVRSVSVRTGAGLPAGPLAPGRPAGPCAPVPGVL